MFHLMAPMRASQVWWELSTQMMVQQMRCAQVIMAATTTPQARALWGVAAPMNACGVAFGASKSGTGAARQRTQPKREPTTRRGSETTLPEEELGLRARRRRRQPASPPSLPASNRLPV